MGVPEPDIALSSASKINLNDYSAGRDIGDCEVHVLDLCETDFTRLAHHCNRLRIIEVSEEAANA